MMLTPGGSTPTPGGSSFLQKSFLDLRFFQVPTTPEAKGLFIHNQKSVHAAIQSESRFRESEFRFRVFVSRKSESDVRF